MTVFLRETLLVFEHGSSLFSQMIFLAIYKFRLSSRYWIRIPIYTILLFTIYIDILTFSILPFQWIKSPECDPPKCFKILLVADPQIIGSQISGHDFLNFVAKWDSDKYIGRTFLQAFHYIKPDAVFFLGDLMDEGHISSDEEFFNDMTRFTTIFHFSSFMKDMPKIFLPGDNDIGGIDDIMLPQVVHRFNKIFNQTDGPLLIDSVEFYKINVMTYEMQEPSYTDMSDLNNNVRVALSHVPLLPNPSQFLQRVVKRIRPQIIFSGHAHRSTHFIASESDIWNRKFSYILPNDTEAKTFNLHTGLIHEIIVPSCSYRMGVDNMGYGAAFIDTENKLLHYSVLWLPRRFPQLIFYLVTVFLSGFILLAAIFSRMFRRLNRLIYRVYYRTGIPLGHTLA